MRLSRLEIIVSRGQCLFRQSSWRLWESVSSNWSVGLVNGHWLIDWPVVAWCRLKVSPVQAVRLCSAPSVNQPQVGRCPLPPLSPTCHVICLVQAASVCEAGRDSKCCSCDMTSSGIIVFADSSLEHGTWQSWVDLQVTRVRVCVCNRPVCALFVSMPVAIHLLLHGDKLD